MQSGKRKKNFKKVKKLLTYNVNLSVRKAFSEGICSDCNAVQN